MSTKLMREWKKVYEADLPYIVYELKELTKTPAMVILEGPLGAGKTTFVQMFIGGAEVLSPTYSVVSETKNIIHADFYRLEKPEEVLMLELPLQLEGKEYFFVEWGLKFRKRLFQELPENFQTYLLEIKPLEQESGAASRNFTLSHLIED